MPLHRRQFLQLLAATPLCYNALAHATGRFYDTSQDIITGGGKYVANGKQQFVLALINLQRNERKLVKLDFLAHGIIIDPNDNRRLLVFEKIGPGAAEIDLNTHTVSRRITTHSKRFFYGHGAFNRQGDTVYCTETYLDNHKGIINIRNGKTMDVLGEFPTYGENPHECQLLSDGTTLVVTNAGSAGVKNSQPSVTYIDSKSQQLLERVTLTNEQINTGHLSIGDDGSLVVASAPADGLDRKSNGGVSIRSGKHDMLSMVEPGAVVNRMTGEALSVIIDDTSNTAAVTHPDGNMVTFWSVSDRKLLKVLNIKKPRGVTIALDGKSFIISYDADTRMRLVDIETLQTKTSEILQPTYISGSHIYNWSRELAEMQRSNPYS
jgi:hypothetical protein